MKNKGKAYIIGAGPGEEELITLKAIRRIKECTVVLYDRLVGQGILKYLNETCEVYYCGKEPGCHYKTQDEINEMIVKLAKEGHIVGRIKGGDPYIFGRGGEEALSLLKENIEFEVVPGVTSPVAVLNYAGIPVTHRKVARSFHVFTAKTANDDDINFEAAAKIDGTLIFLMGYRQLDNITKKLVENGMNSNTPCAVVMRGTTSLQKKAVGTLVDIKSKCEEAKITSPCIIVVGDVINFNEKLDWYEKKPLFGKNICITRAKNQSEAMRKKLIDLGAEVTEVHSIEIKSTASNLDKYLDKVSEYEYIILTSVNAVNILFDYLISKDYDVRKIKSKFAVIGNATAKALKNRGIVPEIISRKHTGESLFEDIKGIIKKEHKIFIPRSKNSRKYIKEELLTLGCKVDECFIYETIEGTVHDKKAFSNVDTIIFTSPSTVKNMIAIFGEMAICEKKIIAIGPITGQELDKINAEYSTCSECSEDAIIRECLIDEK
ncbi:uroporphyrinogen-III C-methyltransferase [Clostridium felsineum]|uniref:Siroheme synthase n=1 Tax=Clostridium felsineum TaxID=36839 RepID=A0A1S8L3L5_9CLOT|nr:uroporphyrinogen-III C-methyltransferase [Clostridium felsineum]URZ08987.1 Siroheme synthase [Clostridium felsineum]URZ09615.1 Siroheme synthase [Clostridium felsineum]